jgi:hypothetical protein
MGVWFNDDGKRRRPYRACIERHGTRFERWYETREEAQKAVNYWEHRMICMFGPRTNKKLEALNASRERKALRNLALIERQQAEVPCGRIERMPAMKYRNHRCRPGETCPHYEDVCLMLAAQRNWAGWMVV